MLALVAGIYGFTATAPKTWMAGNEPGHDGARNSACGIDNHVPNAIINIKNITSHVIP
jgi:hypothetical protein